MKPFRYFLILTYFTIAFACGSKENRISTEDHAAEVEVWYQERIKSLKADEKHKYLHAMLMQCLSSKDAAEGLAAFKDKRKANWTGQ